ncbi:hypothetical protein [Lacticaseibacillus manihotivorans]|uniref:hypothetical protein n=1 Tax=Lacticaseibacillus manihotivorans TaxID=88233 RepID=UPI001FB27973|nr:hypothetical protein [Lacticaseibacillus manihotivorans]
MFAMAGFNALDRRKERDQRTKTEERKQRGKITAILPIAGISKQGYIILKSGLSTYYADVMKPEKHDLDRLTLQEADAIENGSWRFMRQYTHSVKEIFLNFPENNDVQQRYFRHLIKTTTDPFRVEQLEKELYNLQYLEQHYRKLSSWIMLFGTTLSSLRPILKTLRRRARSMAFSDNDC